MERRVKALERDDAPGLLSSGLSDKWQHRLHGQVVIPRDYRGFVRLLEEMERRERVSGTPEVVYTDGGDSD